MATQTNGENRYENTSSHNGYDNDSNAANKFDFKYNVFT